MEELGLYRALERTDFTKLRAQFRGLRDGAHKQIGLRAIRDGLASLGRNEWRAQERYWHARGCLPMAKALTERFGVD